MSPETPPTELVAARTHASILDVAALAGVSPSTVSRSLRGLPNVSEETRQRVIEAAAELSYVVSPSASGLASGQTRAIGVVVPFVTRWFFANAVAGACDVLAEAGYDVLLYHLGSADARDRFFDRMPLARRVDAVMTLAVPLTDEHTLGLRALGMPLITVGAQMDGVTCVRIKLMVPSCVIVSSSRTTSAVPARTVSPLSAFMHVSVALLSLRSKA